MRKMSAFKSYFLVLFLLLSGCATQQMSGSSQGKQSPSSSGGMPSSSSSGGMPSSSESTNQEGQNGNQSNKDENTMPTQAGISGQQTGQSASSIFNESLGDFDKEMAGERDIIAASNRGKSSMSAQEIADMESIMGAVLDGPIDISGDFGNDESEDNNSEEEFTGEMSEEDISRLPSCVDKNSSGEDKIARQLRVFAIKEDDPNIRNEIWKQYLKHMGIGQSQIEECLSK